jgi:hypothetical protein
MVHFSAHTCPRDPCIPGSPATVSFPKPTSRHRRGESYDVNAKPILGGLHHEYSFAPIAA